MLIKSSEQHAVSFPRRFKQYFLYRDSPRIWRMPRLADWKCSLSWNQEFFYQSPWFVNSRVWQAVATGSFQFKEKARVHFRILFACNSISFISPQKAHQTQTSPTCSVLKISHSYWLSDILQYVTFSHAQLWFFCLWSSQFSNQKSACFNTICSF